MAKALKCDRCGQFYDLLTESRNYRIRDFSEPIKYEKYVDLCPDCYKTFTKWLTGEKPLYQLDPISDLADSVYGTGLECPKVDLDFFPSSKKFEEDSE